MHKKKLDISTQVVKEIFTPLKIINEIDKNAIFDILIHCASATPNNSDFDEIFKNRKIDNDLCDLLEIIHIKHFIYLSSMSVYGNINRIIDENTKPNSPNQYGLSKF